MRSCCCTPKVTTYSGSTPHSSSVRTLEHVLVSHYFFYLFITLHILWINEFRFEILNENNNNKSKCVWLKVEKITWQMRMSLFCFICRIHVYHCSLKSLSDMLAKHPWYYLHVVYFQVSGTTYSSSRTCPSSSLCHLPISSRSRKDLLVWKR